MKKWLETNGKALQSLAAIITMVTAIVALAVVKFQIDASARQIREQSARDIYREFLKLSIEQEALANPDFCALQVKGEQAKYENYVEYLLYTSEQVLAELPEWENTINQKLIPHRDLICSDPSWKGEEPEMQALLTKYRTQQCANYMPPCN